MSGQARRRSKQSAGSDLERNSKMERVKTAHRQLRCILWVAEAAIIAIALVTAYQIGME